MPTLTQRLKDEARRLGCVGVGIANAVPLHPEGDRLQEWLDRGYQGTMGWMARRADERKDPALVLPDARSVISIAVNYYSPEQHIDAPGIGKVSRYAWGIDYHDVVLRIADQVSDFLRSQVPDSRTRSYVDTGPVMDKAWAARAGVGWIGKHSNVITRDVGSWVFLGTLFTTTALDPDDPATDMCGTCTACLDACPTSAIVQPYVVDARACISYLTIEHRGEILPEHAARMEGWVHGCDICQDVCPWNKFERPSEFAEFHPRPEHVAPSLAELASLTPDDFRTRFEGSPLSRPKHSGLLRNARAALESLTKSKHLMKTNTQKDLHG